MRPRITSIRSSAVPVVRTSIPDNAVNVKMIFHHVIEPVGEYITGDQKKFPKPWRYYGMVTEPATINMDEGKESKKDNKMARFIEGVTEPIVSETKTVQGFDLIYVTCFTTPRPKMIPGHEYVLEGVVYNIWGDNNRTSFKFSQSFPTGRTLLDMSLPFDKTCLVLERDCKTNSGEYAEKIDNPAPLVIRVENDPTALKDALENVTPIFIGRFDIPDPFDATVLNVTKKDNSIEIGFRPEKASPTMTCVQNTENSGLELVARFGGYKAPFEAFGLGINDWKALGPNIVPKLTGVMFGTVNREQTKSLGKPEGIDGAFVIDDATIFDVAKTIKRCGVPMDKDSLTPFLGTKTLNNLVSNEWEGSFQQRNGELNVINLLTITGDATKIPNAEFYIVSNHRMSDDDIHTLKTAPVQQRIDTLTGVKGAAINAGYGREQPKFAVYAIGEAVRKFI